jgi:DNA primase
MFINYPYKSSFDFFKNKDIQVGIKSNFVISYIFLKNKNNFYLSLKKSFLISEIIQQYGVEINQNNQSNVALCPFHKENTPSFFINDEKGVFKCFGCGISGNTYTFLKKIKGIMTIQKKSGPILQNKEIGKLDYIHGLYNYNPKILNYSNLISFRNLLIIQITWGFYLYCLRKTPLCKNLLKLRGVSIPSSFILGVGYSLDSKNSLFFFCQKFGITYQEMVAVGVVIQKKSKNIGTYGASNSGTKLFFLDIFRYRIIIPIKNQYGVVVAFGGRKVTKIELPKYINSFDSDFFKKNRLLFQYSMNYQYFSKKPKINILAEGYLDCIGLFQNGIRFSSSPLGTSVNFYQIKYSSAFSRNKHVLFCFDSDEPGKKAFYNLFIKNSKFLVRNIYFVSSIVFISKIIMKDPDEIAYFRGGNYLIENVLNLSIPGFEWIIFSIGDRKFFSAKNFKNLISDIFLIMESFSEKNLKNFLSEKIFKNLCRFESNYLVNCEIFLVKIFKKQMLMSRSDQERRLKKKDKKNAEKTILYFSVFFPVFKDDFSQMFWKNKFFFKNFTYYSIQKKMAASIYTKKYYMFGVFKKEDFFGSSYLILDPKQALSFLNQNFGIKDVEKNFFCDSIKSIDITVLNLNKKLNLDKKERIAIIIKKFSFLRLNLKNATRNVKYSSVNFSRNLIIFKFFDHRIMTIFKHIIKNLK